MCGQLMKDIKNFIEKEVSYRVSVMKKFEVEYKTL